MKTTFALMILGMSSFMNVYAACDLTPVQATETVKTGTKSFSATTSAMFPHEFGHCDYGDAEIKAMRKCTSAGYVNCKKTNDSGSSNEFNSSCTVEVTGDKYGTLRRKPKEVKEANCNKYTACVIEIAQDPTVNSDVYNRVADLAERFCK